MQHYVIDSDEAFNDFNSMLKSGEAKILEITGNIAKVNILKQSAIVEINDLYMSNFSDINKIIYGKDNTSNIVNISVYNNTVYIFTEDKGVVSVKEMPYKHWVLSPKQHNGYVPLKGNQYYKYLKEYTIDEFYDIRDKIYKNDLYTVYNFSESFMLKNGYTYFKNMRTQDVSLLSFDIETTGTNPNADDAKVLLITNTFRKQGKTEKTTFNIEDYETQQDMIMDWCNYVNEKDPSLLIGHNIIIFDIPYISTQMKKINLDLPLGRSFIPVQIEEEERELRKDGSQSYSYHKINVFGREIVDTFFLAIKADIARKYESYGLKSIIKQEGLEKENRQHYDASKIKDNWNNPEERKKIIQYAEDDSDDPIKLFDLMIAPFFYLTPHIPKPFQMMIESATGSQINGLMVRSYLQDGFSVAKKDEIKSFEGAISFGNVGIYKEVLKVDVASLYPSIMRQYKIYPKSKDYNGNFLKALEYFTLERLKNKKLAKETGDRYYKDLEQAQKVLVNSSYGFMGAKGLNYNYGEGASEVTRYGREIISKAVEWATGCTTKKVIKNIVNEGKENQEIEYEWIIGDKVKNESNEFTIVNCDTDSISFTTGEFLNDDKRKFLLKQLNDEFPELIRFEDDGYFKTVVVLKAKNYILYDGEKIKLKGSSIRDTKKEPALKEMLDKMIDCLIHEHPNDAINVYNLYIKECLNVKNIARWASKKTVTKSVLNCANDPTARLNERKVYDAITNIKVQEGDKVYLYPAILDQRIETTQYKNGKIKEKVIKTTGLKLVDAWTNDHDVDKLIERVYNTAEILSSVLDINKFIDYTLIKNKPLLKELY